MAELFPDLFYDSTHADIIYFRPFNFRYPDTARRRWSLQYVSMPDYDWQRLRKEHPLRYENKVKPVPDPDDWFHAKIIITKDSASVYVNHSCVSPVSPPVPPVAKRSGWPRWPGRRCSWYKSHRRRRWPIPSRPGWPMAGPRSGPGPKYSLQSQRRNCFPYRFRR